MEGKLPVEVPLNNIDPGRISRLTLQLLKRQQDFSSLAYTFEPFNEPFYKSGDSKTPNLSVDQE